MFYNNLQAENKDLSDKIGKLETELDNVIKEKDKANKIARTYRRIKKFNSAT